MLDHSAGEVDSRRERSTAWYAETTVAVGQRTEACA